MSFFLVASMHKTRGKTRQERTRQWTILGEARLESLHHVAPFRVRYFLRSPERTQCGWRRPLPAAEDSTRSTSAATRRSQRRPLLRIKELYAVEDEVRGLPPELRRRARQDRSK